jgi:hypothetical protein
MRMIHVLLDHRRLYKTLALRCFTSVLREAGLIDQRHHGNGSSVSLCRGDIERHLPGLLSLRVQEIQERKSERTS